MRKLLVVFAALSMALAAIAYSLWQGQERERARADALQARIAALESLHPAKPAQEPTQAAIPAAASGTAASPSATDVPGADADNDNEYRALRRRLLRDPKYYEVWRASARLDFAARRDEMVRELGIPPAKADEMVEYWIDRRLRAQTIDVDAKLTGPEQLAQQELFAQQQREADEKWHAIIGNELFGKMETYEASRPSRYSANQLRERLAGGSDALRPNQFEPLVGLLHTENVRLEQEQKDFVATLDPDHTSVEDQQKVQQKMLALREESNRRIHNSASAALSPVQLAELDAVLRVQFEHLRANSTLSSMEANASGN